MDSAFHATLKLGLGRVVYVVIVRRFGRARQPYISFFSHCLSFLISSRLLVGTGL